MLKKRDKHPTGEQIEIDMDTLRASTRAAAEREQRKAERERERERDRQLNPNASGASGSASAVQKGGIGTMADSAGMSNMPSSAGSGPNISPRSAHSQASGSYTTEAAAYVVEPSAHVSGQMLPPLSLGQNMQNPHQQQQYYTDTEGQHQGYTTRVTGPPGSGLLHIRTASTT